MHVCNQVDCWFMHFANVAYLSACLCMLVCCKQNGFFMQSILFHTCLQPLCMNKMLAHSCNSEPHSKQKQYVRTCKTRPMHPATGRWPTNISLVARQPDFTILHPLAHAPCLSPLAPSPLASSPLSPLLQPDFSSSSSSSSSPLSPLQPDFASSSSSSSS